MKAVETGTSLIIVYLISVLLDAASISTGIKYPDGREMDWLAGSEISEGVAAWTIQTVPNDDPAPSKSRAVLNPSDAKLCPRFFKGLESHSSTRREKRHLVTAYERCFMEIEGIPTKKAALENNQLTSQPSCTPP